MTEEEIKERLPKYLFESSVADILGQVKKYKYSDQLVIDACDHLVLIGSHSNGHITFHDYLRGYVKGMELGAKICADIARPLLDAKRVNDALNS